MRTRLMWMASAALMQSCIIAGGAEDLTTLESEGFLNQRHSTFTAFEALFVPMLVMIGQVLQ